MDYSVLIKNIDPKIAYKGVVYLGTLREGAFLEGRAITIKNGRGHIVPKNDNEIEKVHSVDMWIKANELYEHIVKLGYNHFNYSKLVEFGTAIWIP